MKLSGSYPFEAPQELVWEMLQDPEVLARVMPGAQSLTKTGENQYEGELKIKVGPVQGVFAGTVVLRDLNPPHSYTMQVSGRGPAGFVDGNGRITLSHENGATLMAYDGEAQVGGRIAGVGQRLMDSSAKAIIKQSLGGLDEQIQARLTAQPAEQAAALEPVAPEPTAVPEVVAPAPQPTAAPPPPRFRPTPEAPPPPGEVAFALGVAREVINDLLKPSQQKALAGVFVLSLLYLIWRITVNRLTEQTARRVAALLRDERAAR